jgi:hypothetical protein
MTGWSKIEDDVDWTSMSYPTRRISDEWIEKAIFGFRKMKSVPSAAAEHCFFAKSCSADFNLNHFPARSCLSTVEMNELEQWLGPPA